MLLPKPLMTLITRRSCLYLGIVEDDGGSRKPQAGYARLLNQHVTQDFGLLYRVGGWNGCGSRRALAWGSSRGDRTAPRHRAAWAACLVTTWDEVAREVASSSVSRWPGGPSAFTVNISAAVSIGSPRFAGSPVVATEAQRQCARNSRKTFACITVGTSQSWDSSGSAGGTTCADPHGQAFRPGLADSPCLP